MIFSCPPLDARDKDVLGLIHEQRVSLRHRINQNPNRWTGFLRRNTFARALQGSNSIEGYNATLAEAVAIVDEDKPETMEEETAKALQGYRSAMTYVMRTHNDPHTRIDSGFIRSLHFMMLSYDLTKLPGQWRPGHIFVVHEPTGETVYEGPDADRVPELIDELLAQIKEDNANDVTVRAAMAHLNLTMIHPFRDGNGRMARALQTLVLAKEGIVSPEFSSIEEWLGRNTSAYYDILSRVGQGSWHPENDASPWIRFCLRAHYQQSATILKRYAEIGRTWQEITDKVSRLGLPDRCETALIDAAFGFKVRNNKYREDHGLSEVVASRDLRKLSDLELLVPVGEKRGRYYTAGKAIALIREKCRDRTRASDPYEILRMDTPAQGSPLP
jgi:Fic family protein